MRTTCRRGDVEHADLAGQHHQAVVGDPVAGRAQAVAVEDGADDRAVGEGHRRRSVPRLHQRRVVPVEGPAGRVHGPVVLPRLGDHHQHGVVDGAPPRWRSSSTSSNEAESLAPGVTTGKARSSPGIRSVAQQRLTGPHPVAVAGQGVDLAVVGHVPVRVGQRPGRERVGREAGVDQGQAADQPLVVQVGVELGQLVRGQHPLVGDRPGRQRGEVAPLDLVLGPLAHHVGQPVEGQRRVARAAGVPGGRGHEELVHRGAWPPGRSNPGWTSSTGRARQPRTSSPSSAASRRRRRGPWRPSSLPGQEGDARGVAARGPGRAKSTTSR